jgi:hypothetical protein
MGVPRKMMRSLSRRLQMSHTRSPRCVVSTMEGIPMAWGRSEGSRKAVMGLL